MHWLDRLTISLAPRWTGQRIAARVRSEMLGRVHGDLRARHYEAAAAGRRTQGWTRASSDANAAAGAALARLREVARDLVRNNPYAESAVASITDDTVGWGIVAKAARARGAVRTKAADRWRRWAETTACDADGRQDLAGLQKLVLRTVAESGEVLIRRRWRRPDDGLPIPMQLQVLEPDFLDTLKDGMVGDGGGRIIQGIEFDLLGKRRTYWLFPEHPGSTFLGGVGTRGAASQPVSADNVLHVFKQNRPNQARGVSWFAPVLLRLKDFDDYEDAALMKQKIAACLAVLTTDTDGSSTALGTADATVSPEIDSLEPGMIANLAAGRSVQVVNPPRIDEHAEYAATTLRAIAAGIGVPYEALTGDYREMPFSAARMSRLRYWARIEDWRWRLLIPQFCDPVWRWAMQAAAIVDPGVEPGVEAEWTAPPMPMVEPDKEGLAYQRLLRIGARTWPEMIRELGYDPDAVLAEWQEWNGKLDQAGILHDGDPRALTQGGQLQGEAAAAAAPAPPKPFPDDPDPDEDAGTRQFSRLALAGNGHKGPA